MFYLALRGMRGRKRESLFLYIIMLIAFIFAVVVSVLIPSTEHLSRAQRESTYGRWQLLLDDELNREAEALDQAAAAAGAEIAVIETAGITYEGEQIAVLNEELLEQGQFKLTAGRLPEGPDEILLVANQFQPGRNFAPGDRVSFYYYWPGLSRDYSRTDGSEPPADSPVRHPEESVKQALREHWAEHEEAFRKFWDNGGKEKVLLGEDYLKPSAELSEEQLWEAAASWALHFTQMFRINELLTYEPFLLGGEENQEILRKVYRTVYLQGPGFGRFRDAEGTFYGYRDLKIRKSYKVAGILQSYKGTWDLGGIDMPDAFINAAAGAEVQAKVAQIQEMFPDMIFPLRGTKRLYRSHKGDSAAELYEKLRPAYQAVQPKLYQLEGYSESSYGNGYIHGIGEDGQDAYIPVYVSEGRLSGTYRHKYFTSTLDDLREGKLKIDKLAPPPPLVPSVEEQYQRNSYPFRINAAAYPKADSSIRAYAMTSMVVTLTVLSGCAILVVCFIQSKKRIRSLLTFKAIGMESGQAAAMLASEALLFLAASLGPGLVLGLIAARLYLGTQISRPEIILDPKLLGLSLLGISLALAAGFAYPLYKASRLPLTGKAETAVRQLPRRSAAAASYLGLERAKGRFHRRKYAAVGTLSCLILLLALIVLTLAHQAFEPYREEIRRTGRPDYVMSVPFGMSQRFWEDQQTALAYETAAQGEDSFVTYVAAPNIRLDCEDFLADSPLLSLLKNRGDERLGRDENGRQVLSTDVLGVPESSALTDKLLEAAEGEPDKEALKTALRNGTGCILMQPAFYMEDDALHLSYAPGDRNPAAADRSVKVGDSLQVSGITYSFDDEGRHEHIYRRDLKVLAIVRSFPEDGVWPFAGGGAKPFTLVSGPLAVRKIYPKASMRLNRSTLDGLKIMSRLSGGDCNGQTYFQLYSQDGQSDDAVYLHFADRLGYDLHVYREDNQAILRDCMFQRFMVLLLGLAAELLLLTILIFLVFDLVEQERRRIGILRAIGLSRGQLLGGQTLLAAGRIAAVMLAAQLMTLVIWLAGSRSGSGRYKTLETALKSFLWDYPWAVHIGLLAGLGLFLILLHVLPYVRIGRQTVISATREQEAAE